MHTHDHAAIVKKAKDKMRHAKDHEGRATAFVENLIEDMETFYAAAADPSVTKEQILAKGQEAIANLKKDVPDIAHGIAHGV